MAAAHAAAPSDYKRGGNIIWQRGATDELTCQLPVCFVLWNQPRAQWFKASRRAITLTFPSMKVNGTVQCTLDPQAYSTLLNDTIGRQHFNNIMLEHKVKSWMQTHQSGEPALLFTFTCVLNEVVSFSTHEVSSARYGRTQPSESAAKIVRKRVLDSMRPDMTAALPETGDRSLRKTQSTNSEIPSRTEAVAPKSLWFVPLEKALAAELVVENHYLKGEPTINFAFGIEDEQGQVVGVCTIGTPMWSVACGVIGENKGDLERADARWRNVYELNRLWISDDVSEHCIESKFVAWCLRQLKKINPNAVIISYADGAPRRPYDPVRS